MTHRKKVSFVLSILMLMFIWTQSCLPARVSMKESSYITKKIDAVRTENSKPVDNIESTENTKPSETVLTKKVPISEGQVRKFAHIIEYAALGLCTFLYLFDLKKTYWVLLLGTAVGFIDESLQILSNRGAQVQDVWIDILGTAIGALMGIAILLVTKMLKKPEHIIE